MSLILRPAEQSTSFSNLSRFNVILFFANCGNYERRRQRGCVTFSVQVSAQVRGLPCCVELHPPGVCGRCALPCRSLFCAGRTRPSAALSAQRRSWRPAACLMGVRRRCGSRDAGAAPPVHCPKGHTVVCTRHAAGQGSAVTRPEEWRDRCTC